MLGPPSVGSRLLLRKNAETNNEKSNMYACMHACWGIPQLEAAAPDEKMHAGASISSKPVTPEEKMWKN